jgi:hypothetical protein
VRRVGPKAASAYVIVPGMKQRISTRSEVSTER